MFKLIRRIGCLSIIFFIILLVIGFLQGGDKIKLIGHNISDIFKEISDTIANKADKIKELKESIKNKITGEENQEDKK